MNKEASRYKQRDALMVSSIGALAITILGVFTEVECNYYAKFIISGIGGIMGFIIYQIFVLLQMLDEFED